MEAGPLGPAPVDRLVMTSQPGIEPLAALCLQIDANWRIPESLWERLEPLLPTEGPKPKGGRPRALARQCMDGVFYVLRTGCQWKAPASDGWGHDQGREQALILPTVVKREPNGSC